MRHRWVLAVQACLLVCTAAVPTSVASAAATSASATIDAAVEQLLARHQLPGAVLLLARHGNVVHRKAYGAYALDTRLPIASASKWVSAAPGRPGPA